MGKKPFIIIAIGIFLIVGVFVFEPADPKCGSGSLSPGEVCENRYTGEQQSYDDAKSEQTEDMKWPMTGLGAILIAYGGFLAVKRLRNPNWRTAGQPQPQAVAQPGQYPGHPGQQPVPPQQPGRYPAPPQHPGSGQQPPQPPQQP